MRRAAIDALRGSSAADSWTPERYDYGQSTQRNHQQPGGASVGRFAAIRDTLDASYHGTYTEARQRLQDRWEIWEEEA